MSKFYWALLIGGFIGVMAVAFAAYCACVLAGRADDRAERMNHEVPKM
jgi:hypothetical protein